MTPLDLATVTPAAAAQPVALQAARPATSPQPATAPLLVGLADLQPGLFVELDLGWLDHPFSSNRFKLRDADQITTLGKLGLTQVRVRPEHSDCAAVDALQATLAKAAATTSHSSIAATAAAATPNATSDAAADSAATNAAASAQTAAASAAAARRQRLLSQNRALAQSDRLHGETVRAWQALARDAVAEPVRAGQAAAAVATRLVDELGDDTDTSVRVLHEAAGSSASQHAINVSVLALLLARHIGLDHDVQRAVALGALLHDIGKLALPDPLRTASSDQSALALRARRDHVLQGVRLGTGMGLEPGALRVIAQHHELQDGSGLPQGLSGAEITLPARIVALIDHYDRLCNPVGASKPRTPHEAQSVLYAQLRSHFDPDLLAAFVKLMGVYPPGSVVQLSDGRHALVVAVHPAHPLRPSVLVHETSVPRDEALILHLHEQAGLSIRRSLSPAHLPRATLDYLSPRDRVSYYYVHGLSASPAAQVDGHAQR
ncbi:MAG: DUF3391 domain-containing protein [Burkholderiales bacterium]|nr:DUF3391 domain-containing protein [Burkholderiales bacterium]